MIKSKSMVFIFSLFSLYLSGKDSTISVPMVVDTLVSALSYQDKLPQDTFELRHFRNGFEHKYGSSDFDYREEINEKSAFRRFLERLFSESADNKSGGLGTFLVWLIRIVMVLALLYGVYIIISVLIGKEGNWFFVKKSDLKKLSYGIHEDEIKGTDYSKLIQSSEKNGDFRSAVRYRYLLLLQRLSGKGIIDFHRDKTNTDYKYEIKDKSLSASFDYVSYIYDHTWYGAFDMSPVEYQMASIAFDDTIKMI